MNILVGLLSILLAGLFQGTFVLPMQLYTQLPMMYDINYNERTGYEIYVHPEKGLLNYNLYRYGSPDFITVRIM